MAFPSHVWSQLKGISADDLIRALEKDSWEHDGGSGSIRIYRHPSGKRVSVHYHPQKTFGPKLLQDLLADIGWKEADMRKLKLIK